MTDPTEARHEKQAATGWARGVMSELNRDTDQEILAILVANSPLHVMDIARTADRHPITVDQTCARLHDQRQIHPVGRGLYDVTKDGRRRIEECSES
ncbi:hypothetical protein Halar_2446 [halophilic archaeon DL31]|jgi:predicted transcriptional regulator|nr:hypothetical protein Halar_2446 [halophilic archaeon DL31]